MQTMLTVIAIWIVVGVVVALLAGRLISFGSRTDLPDDEAEARAVAAAVEAAEARRAERARRAEAERQAQAARRAAATARSETAGDVRPGRPPTGGPGGVARA